MTRVPVPIDSLPENVRERVRAASPTVLELATDPKAQRDAKRRAREEKHEERLRQLSVHLAARRIIEPVREWAFAHPACGWKFDLAWPEARVALEVDGGAFVPGGGRHGRGAGFREDLAKRNAALGLGWRVVHVLPEDLGKSQTAELVRIAHDAAAGQPIPSPTLLPLFILEDRRKPKRKHKSPRIPGI